MVGTKLKLLVDTVIFCYSRRQVEQLSIKQL